MILSVLYLSLYVPLDFALIILNHLGSFIFLQIPVFDVSGIMLGKLLGLSGIAILHLLGLRLHPSNRYDALHSGG